MEGRRTGIGKGDTDKVSLPRSYYGTRARKESGGGEGNERRRESYPCTIDIRLRFRFYTRLTCYTDGWMDGWNRCSSLQFRLFSLWLRIYDSGRLKNGIVEKYHLFDLDDLFFITLLRS